jgi:hypothetical protein
MEVQNHSDNKMNRNLNKTGNEVKGNMVILSRNVYTSRHNSLIPYHWKSVRLWRYTCNTAGKNKTYLGRQVKGQIFIYKFLTNLGSFEKKKKKQY